MSISANLDDKDYAGMDNAMKQEAILLRLDKIIELLEALPTSTATAEAVAQALAMSRGF